MLLSLLIPFINSFPENTYFISGASPNTSNQLPQERVNSLISAGIFHMNANNARDVDSICNPLAMQCISGYTLKPFFVDPTYATAIRIAYQEINRLRRVLSDNLEVA